MIICAVSGLGDRQPLGILYISVSGLKPRLTNAKAPARLAILVIIVLFGLVSMAKYIFCSVCLLVEHSIAQKSKMSSSFKKIFFTGRLHIARYNIFTGFNFSAKSLAAKK